MVFKKGSPPWNKEKNCPQISKALKETFKKGRVTWNKGLRGIKTSNKGQEGRKLPTKIVFCLICNKEMSISINKNRKVCSKECQAIYQKTKEYRECQRQKAYHRNKNTIKSSPENFMVNILKSNNIRYTKGMNIYGNPDFVIKKVCIFLDGEYWHNYPNRREIDIAVTKRLNQEGFKVLRFWVNHEFYLNPTKCLNKIKKKTFIYS